jgi:hemerythrin-like domain-containing protein
MKPPFPTPAAGFDHPFEVIDGCHERIKRHCATIAAIAAHVADHGPDGEAREAARGVVRFFDTAGANHHRDEEHDLFPALVNFVPSAELNATRALIARLKADHKRLDAAWAEMRRRLMLLAAGGACEIDLAAAEVFGQAYERHIALEEAELLPLARRIVDARLAASLGERMALRRGVRLPA